MPGEVRRRKLRALLRRAGAADAALELIEPAFVHESAVREGLAGASNERLEFVGDAIVGFIVARWLFMQYPDAPEGELAVRKAALVSDAALAQTAERLGFEEFLVLGAGLAKLAPARHRSTLANAFEAFVAALVLAAGIPTAERLLIKEHLGPTGDAPLPRDPKTALQEWTQKRALGMPLYTESAEGPAHERLFSARVAVGGEELGEGTGPSKKAAQQAAAAVALARVEREGAPEVAPGAGRGARKPKKASR
ncbi:MAG TPA: ribonuclease III [Candidatus Acidoferrales bacterium]|nr:ribonuclease III [Candidatus Acidoferrales bacterium]